MWSRGIGEKGEEGDWQESIPWGREVGRDGSGAAATFRFTVKTQEAQTLPGTACLRLLSAGHPSRLSVIHPHACICTTVPSPPLSQAHFALR